MVVEVTWGVLRGHVGSLAAMLLLETVVGRHRDARIWAARAGLLL
jgi:hypothetical protein